MSAEIIPWRALVPVLDALAGLGVQHHVGGSVASSLMAVSRATQDIDLVADLEVAHVVPLVAALGPDYYADDAAILEAVRRRASFNLIHLPSMFKIDVFVARRDAFSRENMARAQALFVPDLGRELRVCSPEDIVLQKLDWYRRGGSVSERQLADALGILRMHGATLDLEYMRRWADVLGLRDAVEALLSDAGLGA